jgi:hypothetical protein
MAKYDVKEGEKSRFESQYKKDYLEDWDIHRNYITSFDPYEAMLLGQVYDSVSRSVDGAKITDSYAATLAIERAARVMGKLPDGMTESVAKADVGKAAFMDILRQKWIYSNANAQRPFEQKLRLWQLYSSVYGYMPMYYDWNVRSDGTVGPDCWLWNPRNLVPQQGRTSIADMDYVTALTWVGKKTLKNIIDNPKDGDGWDRDALRELLEKADTPSDPDTDRDTKTQRDRIPQSSKKGICLATRYEAGDDGNWCTFAPDNGFVQVRELPNPHKNGKIPFVIKYSQPLFDSFYGLGDFQRAMPLQFARDGLTNFYFKGIKMNLIPPIVANANGVLKHTLDYREGAVMMETIPNSIRRLETSNAGLATFQGAQQMLTGSLLSLYGTQNASLPGAEALNPSQGKTPAAISMYSDKEATRDGQERMYLEQAIEELTDGFFSLVVNIGTEDIPVTLFTEDIQDIIDSGLEDVTDILMNFSPDKTMTAGTLRVDPKKLKGIEYRFNITTNSTAQLSKDNQRQAFENWMGVIAKNQNVIQGDPRIEMHWDDIMKAYGELSGVKKADKFITFDPNKPSPEEFQAQQEQMKQEAAMAQAQSQTQVAMPNGQLKESADLDRIYIAPTTPEDIRRQIEELLGFTPSTQPQPSTIVKGQSFNDSHVGQAAEQLDKL